MSRAAVVWIGVLAVLVTVPGVSGHGWLKDARNWLCGEKIKGHQLKGTFCEKVFRKFPAKDAYNSQSVLTHGGANPGGALRKKPKHVCGFNSEEWKYGQTPWDQALDWPTVPMKAGSHTFRWVTRGGNWHAPHDEDTVDFIYWITKSNFRFNPNRELQWSDFEAKPFCQIKRYLSWQKGGGANRNKQFKYVKNQYWDTYCNVPQRSGHHVIYAEWGRLGGATGRPMNQRFHACLDGMFSGGGSAPARAPPQRNTCKKVQGYPLCEGNDRNICCPRGTKCYAYDNNVSVCLQTCPAGWACARGSTCQVSSGYHLCQGRQRCCPRNTKCYAYSNQVSACMAACPPGWRC